MIMYIPLASLIRYLPECSENYEAKRGICFEFYGSVLVSLGSSTFSNPKKP